MFGHHFFNQLMDIKLGKCFLGDKVCKVKSWSGYQVALQSTAADYCLLVTLLCVTTRKGKIVDDDDVAWLFYLKAAPSRWWWLCCAVLMLPAPAAVP